MDLVLSTDTVPVGDRLDRWRAALGTALLPMAVTPCGSGPLAGRITGGRLGHLRVCSLRADGQRLSRRVPGEALVGLVVLTAGTATLLQDGRHASAGAGDMLVYDTARPYTLDFPGRFACHVVHLPRRGLDVSDDDLRHLTATAISGSDGIGAILGPFLLRLLDSAGSYGPAVAARLAAGVEDLFGTLVAERGPLGGADRGRGELVLRIRAHIDRHLEDPALTPETVAAAHHISVRYLHRLFEDEGITVARLVQRRRLEECARELARQGGAAPAVAAVAHRWGFVNAAHFSRAFRRMYGHSPREWRQLTTAGRAPGQVHADLARDGAAAPVPRAGDTGPTAGGVSRAERSAPATVMSRTGCTAPDARRDADRAA
ncbi:helix-turn-helix domain-containing protein [Streptomyces sp. NPDC028635]|uniref:AraC-like ligand-binding domain-containing protein n=1 Tax=Streptomyces sp. NPDC028635 TaxID=3154800 RepID=UPI0033CDD33F